MENIEEIHHDTKPGESPEPPETADSLQQQIQDLQAKLVKAVVAEEATTSERQDYPLADIILKIGHGNEVPKKGLTPAEVAVLCNLHHVNAGGSPISGITLLSKTESVDPVDLKRYLVNKYTAQRVNHLFPGVVPEFPKSFKRAVLMGINSEQAGGSPGRLLEIPLTVTH